MVVMISEAPPGGHAEGGEHMVTLADHKQNEKNKNTKVFAELDGDEDHFRPLVIDTRNSSTEGATSMEQDKQRLLRQLSQEIVMSRDLALYRENNPPSDAEGVAGESEPEGPLPLRAPGAFSGVYGGHSDSSTPSSRVPSPNLSTASNSGGSSGRSKLSHPQKARRKTDKILPGDGGKYICPICHTGVSSNTELTKHIRSHNNGGPLSANTCTICGKVLSSQSSLDRHMLVHSGERPFKCKHCAMSFTTNGNMHRHSRIHEKEVRTESGAGRPGATMPRAPSPRPPRYPVLGAVTGSADPYGEAGFCSPGRGHGHGHGTGSGSKRKLSFDPAEGPLLPLAVGHSSKRRAVGLRAAVSREFTMLSPEGRTGTAATTPSPTPTPTAASEAENTAVSNGNGTGKQKQEDADGEEHQEFQCPVCGLSFLCKYGLESHVQTHPDTSCHLCPRSFSSGQDLLMHKYQDHKCSIIYNSERGPLDSSGVEDVAVGFHELDFIDFTCEKFPLIAQAWCDENVHSASSAFHDFSCSVCKKAFPCKASLRIHTQVHAQGDATECQQCEIHLEDQHAHSNHMLNHVAPKVVSRVSSVDGASDVPQRVVSKEDFLTCFGLTVSKNTTTKEAKPATKPRQEDMRVNEDYYPLLQRMAQMQAERRLENSAQLEMMNLGRNYIAETPQPPQPPKARYHQPPATENQDHDSSKDLADIQQILNHFGSGGGLVQIRQTLDASPMKDAAWPSSKAFKPLVMVPQSRDDARLERDNGMRLPVMINSGFVPIEDQHPDDAMSSGSGAAETIQCKYCPEVFSNFKSHKSHTRAHLGLAPYKCSLCPYSSADKSTLIRHLRTHNGERPFQCQICDFAFTTKANCERHVRKKHMRFSKKDIDEVIGYNEYPSEHMQDVELFGSPDTVCKFCGEDFKFFRALKHHLRSHSSCERKPFMCRVCDTGFSTKANVVHHVQRQHPEVDERHLEEQIHTNELLAAEVAEDTKVYESIDVPSRSPSPALASSTPRSIYSALKPIIISPVPHLSATSTFSSGTYITSPPIISIHRDTADTSEEQPLDFSMKSAALSMSAQSPVSQMKIESSHMSGGQAIDPQKNCNDEPIDLTLKPSSTPVALTSSSNEQANDSSSNSSLYSLMDTPLTIVSDQHHHASKQLSDMSLDVASGALSQLIAAKTTPNYGMLRYKKDYQKFYNPTVGRLQCPYCKMLFKHGLKLQVHIRSHTNERPFSCAYCSASFTIKTNLERHLKTRHPLQPPIIPEVPGRPTGGSTHLAEPDVVQVLDSEEAPKMAAAPVAVSGGKSSDSLGRQVAPSPRRSSPDGSDDSSCELSSVTKILDATNRTHFRSFFTAAVSDESPAEHSPATSGSPFLSYRNHQQPEETSCCSNHSSTHSNSNSNEHDREELEEDGESSAESDAGLVAAGTGEPAAETGAGSGSGLGLGVARPLLTPEQIIRQTTEKLSIIKIRNPKSAERSPDDGYGSPAKKKRNSYADSPHKLMCPYCPRAFPWISSLNRHILTHTGQKPFKCPQCPVMFSTKSNRERHLVRKHGMSVLDTATHQLMDRPFKCPLCVFSCFTTGANLCRHYEEQHPEEPAPDRPEEADAGADTYAAECQENLEVAEASKAKRLEFGLDDDDSKDGIQDGLGTKLMDHVVHSALVITPRAMTPVSRSASPMPVAASPSSAPVTDRQQINPERDNYNVDKITDCWKCDEEFASRKELLRHLKEHNIDLAFKCYLCDASYDHRLQCVEHMSQRHLADWGLLCEKNQISDVAEFADCMNRIVEQNFIGNSGFGKKLTEAELARYKVQLLEDMKPESDYTQRKVYCSLCPKRFWSLQDLRRHMRSHTGERPFECDLCQKRFTLKHSMMRHRRKHTDARAASLSASDDESGPTAEVPGQAHTNSITEQKQRRDIVVAKVATTGGTLTNLTSQLSSDLLHNLLGVENSAIDEMLTSYSADDAARVLGVTSQ